MKRQLDFVVYGAYGLTGKLFCDFINKNYPNVKWAIVGKQEDRLEEVKYRLKLKDSVEVIRCNSSDLQH
jgi:short subunit dehydrogenase-like uncharacterized protein